METNEIINNMEQFTQTEMERINQLAGENVSNPTIEDMKLYSRWQTSNALANERFKAEKEALQAKMQAEIESAKEIKNAAIANLEAQKQLALARLEAVKNGQISQ